MQFLYVCTLHVILELSNWLDFCCLFQHFSSIVSQSLVCVKWRMLVSDVVNKWKVNVTPFSPSLHEALCAKWWPIKWGKYEPPVIWSKASANKWLRWLHCVPECTKPYCKTRFIHEKCEVNLISLTLFESGHQLSPRFRICGFQFHFEHVEFCSVLLLCIRTHRKSSIDDQNDWSKWNCEHCNITSCACIRLIKLCSSNVCIVYNFFGNVVICCLWGFYHWHILQTNSALCHLHSDTCMHRVT